MRLVLLLVVLSFLVGAQSTAPIRLDPIGIVPPAVNAAGRVAVFGAATAPDGTPRKEAELYVFDGMLRRLPSSGVTSVGFSAGFAGYTSLPAGPGGVEEVHLVNVASGADRALATYKEGCPSPFAWDASAPV